MVQWLRLHIPNARGLSSIPGKGTRSRKLQLRLHKLQLKILQDAMKTKDLHATTKTWCTQINKNEIKYFLKGLFLQMKLNLQQFFESRQEQYFFKEY